jgi:hypothetical protein
VAELWRLLVAFRRTRDVWIESGSARYDHTDRDPHPVSSEAGESVGKCWRIYADEARRDCRDIRR